MGSIGAQASGDGRLSQGALRIVYSLIKDTIPSLSADSFTQVNPSVVATPAAVSTVLPVNVKHGVLGGSVAFTRPDVGPNVVGGALAVAGVVHPHTRPLGLFINDALGNAFENTPGIASGKGPFLRGGAVGVKIYETQEQIAGGGGVGTLLVYEAGDRLYASVNGLLTNRWQDALERVWIDVAASGSGAAGVAIEPDLTRMGVVLSPSDSVSTEMFLELAFV
jgi:hypothetical protein